LSKVSEDGDIVGRVGLIGGIPDDFVIKDFGLGEGVENGEREEEGKRGDANDDGGEVVAGDFAAEAVVEGEVDGH